MDTCIVCGDPLPKRHRKFCSKRCKRINDIRKHRGQVVTTPVCRTCGERLAPGQRKYCQGHAPCRSGPGGPPCGPETTIRELRTKFNNHKAATKIRQHAHYWFRRLQETEKCQICGYDKHVDICHIKGISSFPDSATLREVNDPANLAALCKNHHWELDHGFVTL